LNAIAQSKDSGAENIPPLLLAGAGMTQDDLDRGIARADLCRFLAACFYQPGPEFVEERLFASMLAAAVRVNPEFAADVKRMDAAFAAEDPETLLVDYTRLFLGPVAPLAKPYGSSWQDGQQTLMRESSMEVQELYAQGGFEVDDDFHDLPDHVAVELEFLYLLIFRETQATAGGDVDAMSAMSALRRQFLAEHVGVWIGPFTTAMHDGAETAFYRELAGLTARFVAEEAAAARN
jgi:TorA maturation chaperone TorD